MNHQLLKPVCLVVGRDAAKFRFLQRQLASSAAFIESTEAECLSELVRSGADIVVILWSSTSRQCARLVHQAYPQARVILEGNRTSLPGRPEKNGFLSVIEKSQTRTELLRQIETALQDCQDSTEPIPLPDSPPEESNGIDAHSIIGRLSSIPVVSGDTQRTADHLLDLFLGAIRSGCGALFLQETAGGEYLPVSVRNLPYSVQSLRIAPASKLAAALSGQSAPLTFSPGARDGQLSAFIGQMGCNLVLPLLMEGSLHGFFVFLAPRRIGPAERNTLASMGFFAVETLKQSYGVREARQNVEMNTVFLTRVTDALAWIKPNGELAVVHDAEQLIAIRNPHEIGSFTRMTSSVLKEAVQQALDGTAGRLRFRQKATGRSLVGKTTCLPDGSVILALSAEEQEEPKTESGPAVWRDLALAHVAAQARRLEELAGAELGHGLVTRLRDVLSGKGEEGTLGAILASIAPLFPRMEINDAHATAKAVPIHRDLEACLILLLLSVRLRQQGAKAPLKISLNSCLRSAIQVQLDLSSDAARVPAESDAATARTMEYLAAEGFRAARKPLVFRQAAFGCRWEFSWPINPVLQPLTNGSPTTKSSVSQKDLNVLQVETDSVNHIPHAFNG
jgi:hypothetical protein